MFVPQSEPQMFVLRDLDTGRFFSDGQWISDGKLSQEFPDREAAGNVVSELGLKNAELAFVDKTGGIRGGEPIRVSEKKAPRYLNAATGSPRAAKS